MTTDGGGSGSGVIVCPDCQRTSRAGTNRCPGCGYPLALESQVRAGVTVDPTLFVSPGGDHPGRPPAMPPPEHSRTIRMDPRPSGTSAAPEQGGTLCPSCRKANPVGRERWCAFCAADMTPPARPRLDPPPPPPVQRSRRWPVVAAVVALFAIVGGSAWALGHGSHKTPPPVAKKPSVTSSPPPTVAAPVPKAVPAADVVGAASSTLADQDGLSYGIANTLDGLETTAWNSNGKTTGVGVTLTYTFRQPVDLRWLMLRNGYVASKKGGQPYRLNERLESVTVSTSSGEVTDRLADTPNAQKVVVPTGLTSKVTLTVRSFYAGSKYHELALTEIRFYALPRQK